jgi:hypothetical protein
MACSNVKAVLAGALCVMGYVVNAQNVGIGTATPQQRLHVAGHIRTDSSYIGFPVTLTPTAGGVATTGARASTYLIQDNGVAVPNTLTLSSASLAGQFAYIYNADAQDVTFGPHTIAAGTMGSFLFDGTAWRRTVGGTAAADNLGNHIATQNIQLQNNWLSNDGGNEGIRVANNGHVGVGIVPAHPFHVFGQGGTPGGIVADAAYTGAAIQQSGSFGGFGLAQSFTAVNTGTLSSITVRLRAAVAGVTAQLLVYSGSGCGGALLATSSVTGIPGTNAAEDVSFPFPSLPAVTAGSVYTFRVQFVAGAANGFVYWNNGSGYAGGSTFEQTCTAWGPNELRFQVFVNTSSLVDLPLVWTTNPFLGVGTLAPTERLHVNGNTRLDGALTLLADTLNHASAAAQTLAPTRSTFIVKTTAAPAAATRVDLADGTYPGQQLLLISRNTGTNGFRLTEAASNVQLVATPTDLDLNDSILFVWNGQDWVQVSLSNNN